MIKVIPAQENDKQTLWNLSQFYIYDMSAYVSLGPPTKNGFFEALPYFDLYWTEKERHPFLIQKDEHPVGFAFVNQVVELPESNWKMAEFFVMAPYRNQGIGQEAASQLFDLFPGVWEIGILSKNQAALAFWKKVIKQKRESGSFREKQMPHKILLQFKPLIF